MNELQKRTINGSRIKEKPVGYCMLDRHRGFLTLEQMNVHKCLTKHCRKFIPLEHEYWDIKK